MAYSEGTMVYCCYRDQMIMMFPLVLCWLMVVSYSYELHTDTEPLRVQTEVHSQTGM